MTFDQEVHQRLRFEHDPLRVVVGQVRFPTSHQLATNEARAAIQAALAERFPRSLPAVQEVTFGFTPQGPTPPQVGQSSIRFGSDDEQRMVTIGPAMASLETTQYSGWEEFREHLRATLELAGRIGGIGEVSRFGLRYVDELHVEGANAISDWAEIIAASLLGTEDSLARDPRAVRTLQRVSISIDDDMVNVRQGFTQAQGGGGQGSVYLIDTDVFTAAAFRWDVDALMERAERYHGWATSVFVRSLTEAGIARLGGTQR